MRKVGYRLNVSRVTSSLLPLPFPAPPFPCPRLALPLPLHQPPAGPKPPGWAGRNAPTPPARSAGDVGERSEPGEARAECRGRRRGRGAAVAG